MTEYQKLSIKEWALEDRPREKMLYKGVKHLTDAELLAILIGSGNQEETAVELSKRILASATNNLNQLAQFSIEKLMTFKGIGEAKAINIMAALEIANRRIQTEAASIQIIKSSQHVADLFTPLLADIKHEEFWVLFLERSNKIIMRHKISQGGLSGTVIDVRLILKKAIDNLASSIILVHNHPSGTLYPSEADLQITQKIKSAARVMDISVLDHLIITYNGFYSFADEGKI
ncbi:DNA repair protein RadC [Puteibacter caeruleilacunae]|nr:DNA repair protein RadC [Puteibacter caeruleilacunae]